MAEVLLMVKKSLGANAVILHTRKYKRGGVLGIGARALEVPHDVAPPRPDAGLAAGEPSGSGSTPSAARGRTLTETVRGFARYLPRALPRPHPSWRVRGWLKRHPWFEAEVLPALQARIRTVLATSRTAP